MEEAWEGNYSSATANSDVLRSKLAESRAQGKLIQLSVGEARRKYGDRLAVGAFGMVQEGPEKWRLIWDGTHGIGVNPRIRQVDAIPHPMIGDMAAVLQFMEDIRSPSLVWPWITKGLTTSFKSTRRTGACRRASRASSRRVGF